MRMLFVFLFVFFLVGAEGVHSENVSDELVDIATFSERTGLIIDHWEVTIREKMPVTDLNNHVERLENKFKLVEKKENASTKYRTSEIDTGEMISVSYHAIIPNNSHKHGELIITITGKKWDENTRANYEKVYSSVTNDYFSHKAHKFTCLQAQKNDILNKMSLQDNFTKTFNVKHQKSQTDKIQPEKITEEIYGYTDLWNNEIMIMDEPMNIHFAYIQKASGKETVIIGTPILINEY